MGKKHTRNSGDLGRALIKDIARRKNKNNNTNSLRHVSELPDDKDSEKKKFESVTEQTSVDSFLQMAELTGAEFKAKRMNTKLVIRSNQAVLSQEEKETIKFAQEEHKSALRIPRKPKWDKSMDADEFFDIERKSFADWRLSLAKLQDNKDLILTPFEKNLEFWRQLWRVVEKSDVIVQIVDARNPLLFWCEDLNKYVQEVDPSKRSLILVNKADLLNDFQRRKWAKYFLSIGLKAVFFSALNKVAPIPEVIQEEDDDTPINRQDKNSLEDSLPNMEDLSIETSQSINTSCAPEMKETESNCLEDALNNNTNSSKVLNNDELKEIFRSFKSENQLNPSHISIGFVGYPNVGKSSTVNCLLQQKKVSVSITPGKTKYFQTHFLTEDILLYDCPGLVFPGFVFTKGEMIISGILPVDKMRDHVPPVNLILSQFPRDYLISKFDVLISSPTLGEDPNRPLTSEEFLNAYGFLRGYMTQRGLPDHPRTSRTFIKDYINGKLLYCHCPPGEDQNQYQTFIAQKRKTIEPTPQQRRIMQQTEPKDIDKEFFAEMFPKAHTTEERFSMRTDSVSSKPWRINTKRNRRQKLRKKFAHLDN